MKGFKDSTKMTGGHHFARTAVPIKTHMRAMPAKKMPAMTMGADKASPMTAAKQSLSTKARMMPVTKLAKGGTTPKRSSGC